MKWLKRKILGSKFVADILDVFATYIAAEIKEERKKKKYYWMATLLSQAKDPSKGRDVIYCRWYITSEGVDPVFPYADMLKEFSVKYKTTPTLISAVRISENDYKECFFNTVVK